MNIWSVDESSLFDTLMIFLRPVKKFGWFETAVVRTCMQWSTSLSYRRRNRHRIGNCQLTNKTLSKIHPKWWLATYSVLSSNVCQIHNVSSSTFLHVWIKNIQSRRTSDKKKSDYTINKFMTLVCKCQIISVCHLQISFILSDTWIYYMLFFLNHII